MWVNGSLETTFNIPLNTDVKIDRIALYSGNACCDGRNDNYAIFDNIIVSGIRTGLLFADDFENYAVNTERDTGPGLAITQSKPNFLFTLSWLSGRPPL